LAERTGAVEQATGYDGQGRVWAGLGAGFPLAIYMFIGWENSTMLAEETEDPRRNIPRALRIGALSIGVFYVFLAFATTVGFQMNAKAISGASIPFLDAMKDASPGLLIVAYIAGLTSILSSLIGLVNSQARILFNSGREGLLPRFFGKVHPQHQTPHVAMWAFLVIALALVLGFGLLDHVPPLEYFGFVGTLGAIPIIVTYLFTNLALPIYVLKHKRSELKVLPHIVLPLLGTLALLLPLWGLIQPGQAWPFSTFPWVALGALVVAGGYGAVLARRSPGLAHRIGAYVADE
jgi:amino acid transporter